MRLCMTLIVLSFFSFFSHCNWSKNVFLFTAFLSDFIAVTFSLFHDLLTRIPLLFDTENAFS